MGDLGFSGGCVWDNMYFRLLALKPYSRSFNFTQLRFCPRGLHTAREAVADARSSRGEAGRCA